MSFKAKLLTAAPPSRSNKIKEVYLAPVTDYFYRDLMAMDPVARHLVLNGVLGVSLNKKVHIEFGEFKMTMPYSGFLALNRAEKIDYDDMDDIVSGTARFYNRIIDGVLGEASPHLLSNIIRDILFRVGNRILSSLVDNYSSVGSYVDMNYNILSSLSKTTRFDSVNELVWYVMMFLEKSSPKEWKDLNQKQVDSLEKSIRAVVKEKIKNLANAYKGEREIVLTNKRLIVPRGTVVDDLASRLYNKFKRDNKLENDNDEVFDSFEKQILSKIYNYGISFGPEDQKWLNS